MKKFIKRYNEWLSIPIAIALFLFAPVIYRLFDPTAGEFDAGYLHALIYAIIAVNVASGISWFLFRLNFPKLYRFWDDGFEDVLLERHATDWQKKSKASIYSALIYAGYFTAMIILTIALL